MTGERISRLEGAFQGVRHTQNITIGALGLLGAVLIALGGYAITKIDKTNDRIDQLPARISADLQNLTTTLATSISAAKQSPQVIIVPASSGGLLPAPEKAPQQ